MAASLTRSHAFNHLAIGWDQVPGFDQHEVADFEVGARHQPVVPLAALTGEELGLCFSALAPQRLRLRLAAAFRDRRRDWRTAL